MSKIKNESFKIKSSTGFRYLKDLSSILILKCKVETSEMLPRYCIILGSACIHLVAQFVIWKCLRMLKFLVQNILWVFFCLTGLNIPAPITSMSTSRAHKLTCGSSPGGVPRPWDIPCQAWPLHKSSTVALLWALPAMGKGSQSLPSPPRVQDIGVVGSQTQAFCLWPGHSDQQVCSPMEVWEKGPAPCWSWAGRKEILNGIDAAEEEEKALKWEDAFVT